MSPFPMQAGARRVLVDGLTASALSTAALLWCGRRDLHRASVPVNVISHWVWPRQALRAEQPSWRHTGTGLLIHTASSLWWAAVHGELRARRPRPGALPALVDAAGIAAMAAWVDLVLVPPRISPGFQWRLRPAGTGLVYAAFAAGLLLCSLAAAGGAPAAAPRRLTSARRP